MSCDVYYYLTYVFSKYYLDRLGVRSFVIDRYRMKFALVRRRAGEDTALHSVAVSTGPIYPPLGNYVWGLLLVESA